MNILVHQKAVQKKPVLNEVDPGTVIQSEGKLWLVGKVFSEPAGIQVTSLENGSTHIWNKFTADFEIRADVVLTSITNCKSLWPEFHNVPKG